MLAELEQAGPETGPEEREKRLVRRWAPLSGGAPKQVVFLCHGFSSGPNQLSRFFPAWREAAPDAVFVAPRAPQARVPRLRDQLLGRRPPGLGNQWFGIGRTATVAQEKGVREAARWLDEFIDNELREQGVPPGAYAMIGFSQGAVVALYAGLRRTPAPACIVCHAAELLSPERLAGEMRCTPKVTLVLAEEDDVIPYQRGFAAEAALRAAGVPVSTIFLEGVGHDALKGVEEDTRPMVSRFAASALMEAFGA